MDLSYGHHMCCCIYGSNDGFIDEYNKNVSVFDCENQSSWIRFF